MMGVTVAWMLLLAVFLGGCGRDQRSQPQEIWGGQGPPWFGVNGEPVDVLRWQRPLGDCGYGHASTQLWVAPWDYGEVQLPAGSFDVLGPRYEPGQPPRPARRTPLWSAAGRLWLLPGDDDLIFLVKGAEYLTLRRPEPLDPSGPCIME